MRPVDRGLTTGAIAGAVAAMTMAAVGGTLAVPGEGSQATLTHDGLSFTKQEAIARHASQATAVRTAFDARTPALKDQLLAFLDSL